MKSEGTRFGLAAKEDSTNQTTNESTDGNDTELCYLSSFSCLSLVAKNSSIWYADSGATMHMTDQLSAFVNYSDLTKYACVVRGIGNITLAVQGRGDVEITTRVNQVEYVRFLRGVLYVPKLGTSLMSIAAATDAGVNVEFSGTKVYFSRNGTVEIVGQRFGRSLYQLNLELKCGNAIKTALLAKPSESIALWHRRLAHLNYDTIQKLSKGLADGINLKAEHPVPSTPCEGCILGKMHRLPFPERLKRTTEIGEIIHSDVCGPMQVETPNNGRYFVLFKDDFSGWCVVHIIKHKSEAAHLFMDFVALLRTQTGKEVKTLRSDNGGEFTSAEFKEWLAKSGIRQETSAPYTPQQNGVAERTNRTIMNAVRSQMHSKRVPLYLWGEATVSTIYVLNRSLINFLNVTPFESWYGRKPDVSHIRTFGSRVFAHVPEQNRRKLDPKAEKCIFIGYGVGSKAYRLWNPVSRKVIISRDIIVDEEAEHVDRKGTVLEETVSKSCPNASEDEMDVEEATIETTEEIKLPRRSMREPKLKYQNWKGLKSELDTAVKEPKSYQEAIASPEANKWKEAIQDEYNSLINNGTWELVTLPPGRTTIKNRWLFKIKIGCDGIPERYKARLVAKGYTQQYGIDYQETYAPVVKSASLRLILAITAALDLEITQLDIKTAFLHGDLEEEIFMEQPEGFVDEKQKNKVCRLVKSLYGLKQAPRAWNSKFNDFLVRFGLERSAADPCIYYRHKDKTITVVAIHVDDGLVCSNKTEELSAILQHLDNVFEIRSFPANRYLGLDISRNRAQKEVWISQSHFITKLLEKSGMSSCKPKSVPADPNARLESKNVPKQIEEKETDMKYREIVGALMHLTVNTRPEIAFAVNQAAKFCQHPEPAHWNAVKRILAYLAGTVNFGICFRKSKVDTITGYTDADYAGDVQSRRSTTGFVFILHGGPVSWASKRQTCTSLSTTESEYVAACETSKEAVWLQQLVSEISNKKKEVPIPLFCDNQSAIRLVRNPEFHQRTKHIDVKYHFIRDQQEGGKIDLQYIPSDDQLADVFTKPLAAPRFKILRDKIGVKLRPVNM